MIESDDYLGLACTRKIASSLGVSTLSVAPSPANTKNHIIGPECADCQSHYPLISSWYLISVSEQRKEKKRKEKERKGEGGGGKIGNKQKN